MAVTLVQSKKAAGNNAVSTFASPVTAGNTIVVLIEWTAKAGSPTLSSVTDDVGNVYTIVGIENSPGAADITAVGSAIAYCMSAIDGATTITTSYSAGIFQAYVSLYELSASVFDQSAHANGVGTAVSAGSITTTVNGCYALVGANIDNNRGAPGGWTAGSGWTLDLDDGGGEAEFATAYQAQAVAGALTGDFTEISSGTWVASMATFKPAAATFVPQILAFG